MIPKACLSGAFLFSLLSYHCAAQPSQHTVTLSAPNSGAIEQQDAYATPLDGAVPIRTLWVSPSGNDSYPGTISQPKKTINAAVAIATPGTQIRVKAGTYSGSLKFKQLATTTTRPIWLISQDGPGRAKIASGQRDVFAGYGVANIIINGFYVMGATRYAFSFGEGSPTIAEVGDTKANVCRNIILTNNTIENTGSDAIHFNGCIGVYILNNRISKADRINSEETIDTVAVNTLVIAGNVVTDCREGIAVKGGSSNVLIKDNKLLRIALNGIYGGGRSDSKYMWRTALANKYEAAHVFIQDNEVQALSKRGILTMGCANCTIDGNLVHANTYYYGDVHILSVNPTVHGTEWYSRSVIVKNNCVGRSKWLYVEPGNRTGFSQANNSANACN